MLSFKLGESLNLLSDSFVSFFDIPMTFFCLQAVFENYETLNLGHKVQLFTKNPNRTKHYIKFER